MQTTSVKLHSLRYADARTYLAAALFVAGNLALPQLCHAVHMGGPTWLPIYFFTLVGAYKYGWRVGLLTALASPLLNSVLFGMPLPAMLPAIVLKSLAPGRSRRALPPHASAAPRCRCSRPSCSPIRSSGSLGEWALTARCSPPRRISASVCPACCSRLSAAGPSSTL